MKNLREKLNINYFDCIMDQNSLTDDDFNSPRYLGSLTWCAYLAYIKVNIDLAKEILEPFISLNFDGNYDK